MEKKKVDCVVIGSGMGGITAAALMAHYGYKVLVAERLTRLGGRFSTQEIDGFKCPTGALIIQRGTELEETFKVTGAKFDIADCAEISWNARTSHGRSATESTPCWARGWARPSGPPYGTSVGTTTSSGSFTSS